MELAEHIRKSHGPSGGNKEYLYELYQSLEQLCPESKDNHVRNLFRKVAILDAEARLNDTDESGEGLMCCSMGEPTPMDEAELLDASIDNDIEMKN